MGSFWTTTEVKSKPVSYDQLTSNIIMQMIINHWLLHLQINLFPDELKHIIIDTYTYQPKFDIQPQYPFIMETLPKKTVDMEYDYLFRLLVIGDSYVGKTSLITRFADDCYASYYNGCIGVDFKVRTIELNGKIIKLQVWDTAGQERFRVITPSYYKRVQAILLCYDITDSKTLANIKYWNNECIKYGEQHVSRILVGCKCDL
eukprot:540947_1